MKKRAFLVILCISMFGLPTADAQQNGPQTCDSDADCVENEICDVVNGNCIEGCETDDTCSEGRICESESSYCLPGCRSDDMCDENEECVLDSGPEVGECRLKMNDHGGCNMSGAHRDKWWFFLCAGFCLTIRRRKTLKKKS